MDFSSNALFDASKGEHYSSMKLESRNGRTLISWATVQSLLSEDLTQCP